MDKPVTITFRATEDLYRRFTSKLPKNGDRSVVLRQLLELYVNDKIKVAAAARP